MVTQNPDMTFSAEIEGRTYKFAAYDADKGFRVLCEISGMLATGIGHGKGIDSHAAMAAAICGGLGADSARSLRLVKQLCCDGVEVNGQRLTEQTFTLHFARNMGLLFQVVAAAIEVQFGNFFELLQSILEQQAALQAAMRASSPSPTTT